MESMDILKWLQDWAGVLVLLVGFLTLIVSIILTLRVYKLQKNFSIKQKMRADIELIMSWATSILSLQNEYFITEDLEEIYNKCENLSSKYFEVSLLAGGLNESIYDKSECLKNELDRFGNFLRRRFLDNKKEIKEVPYSKEINTAVKDLLQESVNFRKNL
jgi:hypothetical protein